MLKKISIILLSIMFATTLTSCGKYGKLYEALDSIEIQTVFPEAVGGATTFEEASWSVYVQQKGLCEAMIEAYKHTDVDSLREEHSQINRNKMMSELSKKRQSLNNDSSDVFIDNLRIVLENVDESESDKDAFIKDCIADCTSFYTDYEQLVYSKMDNFEKLSKIFVTYSFSDNSFAKSVLIEYTDKIIEAATLTIEKNAREQSSFRSNISKNNEIIKAINEILGGVNDNEYKSRINLANKMLLEKTLNSMSSMSQKERDTILSQFEEA